MSHCHTNVLSFLYVPCLIWIGSHFTFSSKKEFASNLLNFVQNVFRIGFKDMLSKTSFCEYLRQLLENKILHNFFFFQCHSFAHGQFRGKCFSYSFLVLGVRYCKVLHHIDKKWTSRKTPEFSTSYCHFNWWRKLYISAIIFALELLSRT